VRLGAPILGSYSSHDEWISLVRQLGASAAYCPLEVGAKPDQVDQYARAAEAAGLVIAEVGAWEANPLSTDAAEAERSIRYCQEALRLADSIGARCCVNVAGSLGTSWAGPAAENFSQKTFRRIVETTQLIIDAVQPERTFYTLEIMPWIPPYDLDSYLRLIEAIDREAFAVHFDPANLVNDPSKYYYTGQLTIDFVRELGPRIRSCHVKDTRIDEQFPPWTVRFWECTPGAGNLDWPTLLAELSTLDKDLPLMLEHLETAEEYRIGLEFVRQVAATCDLEFAAATVAVEGGSEGTPVAD
jgi:sugar phosphate isomerase/epimerase